MLKLIIGAVAIIISYIFAFYDKILDTFTEIVDITRIFIWENKTLIDLLFLISYAILQLIFIYAITKKDTNPSLVITIFILSLLTLMGIERLFMRVRYNFLDTQMSNLSCVYSLNEADYQRALSREKKLIKRYGDLKTEYNLIKKENKELLKKVIKK